MGDRLIDLTILAGWVSVGAFIALSLRVLWFAAIWLQNHSVCTG